MNQQITGLPDHELARSIADGRYFIDLDNAVAEPPPTEVVLVQNFANELRRLVPSGRRSP